MKRNIHEGKTWSYQTLDEIAAHFPYLSKSEVFELLEKLCLGKGRRSQKDELDFEPVLIKDNFNKKKYDRTTWYAFIDEEKFIILAQAKMEIGSSQNGDWQEPTPIPDTKHTSLKQSVCTVASPENIPVEMLKSNFCKRRHPDGHEYDVSLDEMISQSILQKTDFSLEEINQAWQALAETKQAVRDPFAFIKGTINNFRKNNSNNFKPQKEKTRCDKQKSTYAHSKTSKNTSDTNNVQRSERVTLAQVSQNFPSLPENLRKLFSS